MNDSTPFKPYSFQELVHDQFMRGHNIVLQAPTGAGKTEAALMPALAGFDKARQDRNLVSRFPQRVIYSVPMRVLARGFVEKYSDRAQRRQWQHHWHPTIQTGETPDDELFEGRVMFATVDQVLASFLNIPYGIPRRMDNVNAGAMIGSYLIFDEFHLYPRDEMMLTVLAMLSMLKDVSRFVMMSATFSSALVKMIAHVLGAKVIADDPGKPLEKGHFHDVRPLQTQQRTFFAENGSLTAPAVIERTDGAKRILCITNTVDRAQKLYQDLRASTDLECHLLHSRFYREDRHKIEAYVLDRFEAETQRPHVLVATQVIEVGVDISSEVLLTECAPAASLIQRAGRCARRTGEAGRVYVFQPFDEDGEINYAPYTDEQGEEVCQKTWIALSSSEFNGSVIRFPEEQRLIDLAHGDADRALVEDLDSKIERRIDEITQCMGNRDMGYADKLIRKQSSVPLWIDNAPNGDQSALAEKPWRREAFSLSKGQIAHLFKTLEDAEGLEADFWLMVGIEQPSDDSTGRTTRSVYHWFPALDANEVYTNWRFVAHPDVVSYSPELGLQLLPGAKPTSISPMVERRSWERPLYEAERYHEHISGLYWAYTLPHPHESRYGGGLQEEALYPLRRLCRRMGRDFEQAERLLRLVLALHDVGKLNRDWQQWAKDWQAYRAAHALDTALPIDDPTPLAHTDFDADNADERSLQEAFDHQHAPRGHHAGESAEACLALLWDAAGGDQFWMSVMVAAIMRHHTPDVNSCGAFSLMPGSLSEIAEALAVCGFEADAADWSTRVRSKFTRSSKKLGEAAKDVKPHYHQFDMALMYLLFVRILRLADQRSGKYWRKYRDAAMTPTHESESDE